MTAGTQHDHLSNYFFPRNESAVSSLPYDLTEEQLQEILEVYQPSAVKSTPHHLPHSAARKAQARIAPPEDPCGMHRDLKRRRPSHIIEDEYEDGVGDEAEDEDQDQDQDRSYQRSNNKVRRKGQRFTCPHPGCSGRSFGRRADRDRHVRKHSATERTFVCPEPGCVKRFYRKDKLLDHTRQGHRPVASCTCRNG
ncbi:hypothetical protein BU16DRAFT_358463 [Lophium mytilinum]|uniref:C2H2-type domain-containing protein n=1 Tax=Lophium mytilinum TaxID=390894 RepID=A0A6A6QUI0_9PEZI|nr:hypothetical protein BU16DRAFT_358463 [Lophium mytilinum]